MAFSADCANVNISLCKTCLISMQISYCILFATPLPDAVIVVLNRLSFKIDYFIHFLLNMAGVIYQMRGAEERV